MIIFKNSFHKKILKILWLLLVLMLLQNCKAYKSPTNLEQAVSAVDDKGYLKVTMVNGDEYIYEAIELNAENYYGVKNINGEKVKTLLLKEEVLKVERKNKNKFGLLGALIGLGSVGLVLIMFGG
jgi:hypothetical protein